MAEQLIRIVASLLVDGNKDFGLDWIELDLDWIGLDWIGLDWIGGVLILMIGFEISSAIDF
jgi:hypothetical protein